MSPVFSRASEDETGGLAIGANGAACKGCCCCILSRSLDKFGGWYGCVKFVRGTICDCVCCPG